MISLHFASVLFDPAAVMPRDGEPTKIDFADKFCRRLHPAIHELPYGC